MTKLEQAIAHQSVGPAFLSPTHFLCTYLSIFYFCISTLHPLIYISSLFPGILYRYRCYPYLLLSLIYHLSTGYKHLLCRRERFHLLMYFVPSCISSKLSILFFVYVFFSAFSTIHFISLHLSPVYTFPLTFSASRSASSQKTSFHWLLPFCNGSTLRRTTH